MSHEKNLAVQEIAKGGGILLIGVVLSYFLAFMYQWLAARYLTVDEFGLFSIGTVVLGIGITFSQVGLSVAAKHYVAYYISKNDAAGIKGTLFGTLRISLLLSLIGSIVLYFSSDYLSVYIFKSSGLIPIIRLFSVSLPFSTLFVISNETLIAFKSPILRVINETFIDKGLKLILLFIAIYFGGILLYVTYSYILGAVISGVLGIIFIYFAYKKIQSVTMVESRPARYEYRNLLVFSLPLFLSSATGEMMQRVDKLIIGYYLDPASVAVYSVVFSFAILLSLGLNSFGGLYYPVITDYLQKKDYSTLSSMFMSVSRLSFFITLPLCLVFILFSKQLLLLLFRQEYVVGSSIMIILSIVMMLVVGFGPTSFTLQVFRKTKLIFYVLLGTVLMNFILNLILIPYYGLLGASLATMIAMVSQGAILFHYTKKEIKVGLPYRNYLKYLLSGVMSVIVIYWLKQFLIIDSIMLLAFFGAVFFCVYLLFNILFRSFTDEDVMLLMALEQKFGIKNSVVRRVIR